MSKPREFVLNNGSMTVNGIKIHMAVEVQDGKFNHPMTFHVREVTSADEKIDQICENVSYSVRAISINLAKGADQNSEIEKLRHALVQICRVSFAGPNTDERREWIWATAKKALGHIGDDELPEGIRDE